MLSANNIEGVVAYLNHLAEVNKKDIKVSYLHYEDLDGKHEVKKKKSMVKKLFGKNNLVLTLSLMIIWFTQAFGSSIYSWLPLIMLNHGFVKSKVYVFMMVVQSMPFIEFYCSGALYLLDFHSSCFCFSQVELQFLFLCSTLPLEHFILQSRSNTLSLSSTQQKCIQHQLDQQH